MSYDRNTYGNILKAISLFGGVKVFQILIGIVRNKFVAILLGPEGMGISGMITNATTMISSFTGMGLMSGSVREVALASETGNEDVIAETTTVLKKLVLFTGCLGMIVTFILAKHLSLWSFGNDDYTIAFRVVSIILLLDQLYIGRIVIMQGTFHYRLMAKSSMIGSVIGLFICIPLYFIFKYDGIVPVIVISSLLNFLLAFFFSRRIALKRVSLTVGEVLRKGRSMIKLGLSFAVVGTFSTGQFFMLRLYIANEGSLADVGLYTAGIALTSQYVNTILESMGTDYGPRLSAMSMDLPLFIEAINRQTKLIITIITPLIILFISLINEIVLILYSDAFIPITFMIEWMMLGMFFRATAWCLSYTLAARGEGKLFMLNEIAGLIYFLIFYIIGYKYARFTGLGIAFVMGYICYTIHFYLVCRKLYGFSYRTEVVKMLCLFLFLLFLTSGLLFYFKKGLFHYVISVFGFTGSVSVALYYLNQMIPLKEVFTKIKSFV